MYLIYNLFICVTLNLSVNEESRAIDTFHGYSILIFMRYLPTIYGLRNSNLHIRMCFILKLCTFQGAFFLFFALSIVQLSNFARRQSKKTTMMEQLIGKSKGSRQIRDLQNAYIVRDDIETAGTTTLPLWTFGMMY